MPYLRRGFERLAVFVRGLQVWRVRTEAFSVGLPSSSSKQITASKFSNASAIRSRAVAIRCAVSSVMAGILSPGTQKNNLSLYVALAGGNK
jgi:hypothetical protein